MDNSIPQYSVGDNILFCLNVFFNISQSRVLIIGEVVSIYKIVGDIKHGTLATKNESEWTYLIEITHPSEKRKTIVEMFQSEIIQVVDKNTQRTQIY